MDCLLFSVINNDNNLIIVWRRGTIPAVFPRYPISALENLSKMYYIIYAVVCEQKIHIKG